MPVRTGPKIVANETSAASRPVPMRMSPVIGEMPVGSNRYHVPPISTSTYAWKSGGPSAGIRAVVDPGARSATGS